MKELERLNNMQKKITDNYYNVRKKSYDDIFRDFLKTDYTKAELYETIKFLQLAYNLNSGAVTRLLIDLFDFE